MKVQLQTIKQVRKPGKFISLKTSSKLNIFLCQKKIKMFVEHVIPAPRGIDFPVDHSLSKIDSKIFIDCGTLGSGKASKNL